MIVRLQSLWWFAAFCVACAGTPKPIEPSYAALIAPGVRKPTDDVEKTVLAQLPQLAAGAKTTVHGKTVVVGGKYTAASGRVCRHITVLAVKRHLARPVSNPTSNELGHGAPRALYTLGDVSASPRPEKLGLACKVDDQWMYVPDVLDVPEQAGSKK